MASKTNQSISDFVNYALRGVAPSWASASVLYLAGHTGAVGLGGDQQSNELTYTGYSRISLTRTAGGVWTASSGGSASSNNALLQLGNCTGGTLPETMTHVSIGESASGAGTVIATGALSSPLVININIQPQFAIGALSYVEA
jgi:hypothetical protein